MKRAHVLAALATVTFLVMCAPAQAVIQIEKFASPADFQARLAGFPVKKVNFDDLTTTKTSVVPFATTRYKLTSGAVITGQGGQYASRSFRLPADFKPVSKYNMYAPGPISWTGIGGNKTNVTFFAGAGSVQAAGFGCYFIDADYPGDGPASFSVYNQTDALLGGTGTVVTANAQSRFVGLVAVDSGTGLPVPAITMVNIVAGNGWAGNNNNEGTVLDDFMVGTATYSVTGKAASASGKPLGKVKITLSGGFTLTATTNSKGQFTIPNVPSGTYDVKPSKKGLKFTPVKLTAVVTGTNLKLATFRGK